MGEVFPVGNEIYQARHFGWALAQLKQSKKVARSIWDNRDVWVCTYRGASEVPKAFIDLNLTTPRWFGIRTVDNSLIPWQPTQEDMFAEDWEILPL